MLDEAQIRQEAVVRQGAYLRLLSTNPAIFATATTERSYAASILLQIVLLHYQENNDDYIFKPTPYAEINARILIEATFSLLPEAKRHAASAPRVSSDGTGGILIQWKQNGKTINAGFRPEPIQGLFHYIYHSSDEAYDMVPLTPESLARWLLWLME